MATIEIDPMIAAAAASAIRAAEFPDSIPRADMQALTAVVDALRDAAAGYPVVRAAVEPSAAPKE